MFVATLEGVSRFILGLRQLYKHDVEGRLGNDVDNAFGLTSEVRAMTKG